MFLKMKSKVLFKHVKETFPKHNQKISNDVKIPRLIDIIDGINTVPIVTTVSKLEFYDGMLYNNDFESIEQYEYVMHGQNIRDILNYQGDIID